MPASKATRTPKRPPKASPPPRSTGRKRKVVSYAALEASDDDVDDFVPSPKQQKATKTNKNNKAKADRDASEEHAQTIQQETQKIIQQNKSKDASSLAQSAALGTCFDKQLLVNQHPEHDPAHHVHLPGNVVDAHMKEVHIKKSTKQRYMFVLPGQLSIASGGIFGSLENLDTPNPKLNIDFPDCRVKLSGTIVYPENHYMYLNTHKNKPVSCDGTFDQLVVFHSYTVQHVDPVDQLDDVDKQETEKPATKQEDRATTKQDDAATTTQDDAAVKTEVQQPASPSAAQTPPPVAKLPIDWDDPVQYGVSSLRKPKAGAASTRKRRQKKLSFEEGQTTESPTRRKKASAVELSESDSDQEEEEIATPPPPINRPKRSSARKPIKYQDADALDLGLSDEDEESEQDDASTSGRKKKGSDDEDYVD